MANPDFVISGGDVPESIENTSLMEETPSMKESIISETVVHRKSPLPFSILKRLERQKYKYWHFKFVHDSDLNRLKKMIIDGDSTLTVEHNYGGKKYPDLTIFKNNAVFGKLHFLYVNRPDICDDQKFYIKIHYYAFPTRNDMHRVKDIMESFIATLDTSLIRGGKTKKQKKRQTTRKMRKAK
jgi:hypothetical protein